MSVLGTHLYQCASWRCCERLCSASVNFFWRLFQHVCPFHDGWFMSTPAHTALGVQQCLIKNSMTPVPHPPYSPDLTLSNFFCLSDEKSPQMETFCWCGRGETNKKIAKALKSIKIDECFGRWEGTGRPRENPRRCVWGEWANSTQTLARNELLFPHQCYNETTLNETTIWGPAITLITRSFLMITHRYYYANMLLCNSK